MGEGTKIIRAFLCQKSKIKKKKKKDRSRQRPAGFLPMDTHAVLLSSELGNCSRCTGLQGREISGPRGVAVFTGRLKSNLEGWRAVGYRTRLPGRHKAKPGH